MSSHLFFCPLPVQAVCHPATLMPIKRHGAQAPTYLTPSFLLPIEPLTQEVTVNKQCKVGAALFGLRSGCITRRPAALQYAISMCGEGKTLGQWDLVNGERCAVKLLVSHTQVYTASTVCSL